MIPDPSRAASDRNLPGTASTSRGLLRRRESDPVPPHRQRRGGASFRSQVGAEGLGGGRRSWIRTLVGVGAGAAVVLVFGGWARSSARGGRFGDSGAEGIRADGKGSSAAANGRTDGRGRARGDDSGGTLLVPPIPASPSTAPPLSSSGEVDQSPSSSHFSAWASSPLPRGTVRVFQPLHSDIGEETSRRTAAKAHRARSLVESESTYSSSSQSRASFASASEEEMRAFLKSRGGECHAGGDEDGANAVLTRYNALFSLRPHMANEVFKYCALYLLGGASLDSTLSLATPYVDVLDTNQNYVVLSDAEVGGGMLIDTAYGGFIQLAEEKSPVARGMLDLILNADDEELDRNPLLLPRRLYALVAKEMRGALTVTNVGKEPNEKRSKWSVLEQRCEPGSVGDYLGGFPFGETLTLTSGGEKFAFGCPSTTGHCCEVTDPSTNGGEGGVVFLARHPVLPYQILPALSMLPGPYRSASSSSGGSGETTVFRPDDLPFVATLREEAHPLALDEDNDPTPNFYDILAKEECLPDSKVCSECLRNKKGADCQTCKKACGCFCDKLCKTKVPPKRVSKIVTISPPRYRRDPSRLIPRIVHQTWFEDVSPERYPNMSRLLESWKSSGWDHRFYSDADAKSFLAEHFPPEVLEAYESLIPGAFKADLFRYCALLIHGGVYADMDVLLESNLDAAVAADVGFMAPMDEPGTPANRRMCLWNGFIASAPGHPFLARAIATVVNNVRNRFTSVDVDALLCPDPELSVSHAFDTLFTAGPCVLGYALNSALGRHPQTPFEAGSIKPPVDSPDIPIPGRTIILHQDKWDMGAHRFTFIEENLVVAATDMPDYDDREKLEDSAEHKTEHYSTTHVRAGIYGLEKLYKDRVAVDEEIKFLIAKQR